MPYRNAGISCFEPWRARFSNNAEGILAFTVNKVVQGLMLVRGGGIRLKDESLSFLDGNHGEIEGCG